MLCSPAHARVVVDAGDLGEGRPHEFPSLAKAGIKQYFVCRKRLEAMTVIRKEADRESTGDLKPEEIAQVSASLSSGLTTEVVAKKTKKEAARRCG